MTEHHFNKHIDNLIIEGLIKEGEQNDADFEAAMRAMSDHAFDGLIHDHSESNINIEHGLIVSSFNMDLSVEHCSQRPSKIQPLEQNYQQALTKDDETLQQAAVELIAAYLDADQINKAIKVLNAMVRRFNHSPFAKLCKTLLDSLR